MYSIKQEAKHNIFSIKIDAPMVTRNTGNNNDFT